MLFDDAVNSRQAQARPLPYFLSSKERLEDPVQVFRRNAAAGVGDAQTAVVADTRLRVFRRV